MSEKRDYIGKVYDSLIYVYLVLNKDENLRYEVGIEDIETKSSYHKVKNFKKGEETKAEAYYSELVKTERSRIKNWNAYRAMSQC